MNDDPIIQLRQLTVRYGTFTAVDQLDLDIQRGELFGLLGPNGAGKSTTIRVLIGQIAPSSGQVNVLGRDVVKEWAAIKPLFGYVPDRENHFDEFTGRKNLEFFASLYRVPAPRIAECLARVELTDAANVLVRGYSLGMKRKLLLARALLHKPQLMYLDEPTANLDVHSAAVVRQILRGLVSEGCTILLTTHNMSEVEEICDRVAILCHGRLVRTGTPLALRQEHAERKVDAVLADGSKQIYNLDVVEECQALATQVADGHIASLKTRDFNFHEAFLKLTGTEFK